MNAAEFRFGARILSSRLRQQARLESRRLLYLSSPRCRGFQTTSLLRREDDIRFRPHYVTTPIFYVNAEPHVGHLYTLILTDVLKRWELLKGDEQATLLTGTDEHGMKVQRAAQKLGIPPQELCDTNAAHFLDLAEAANISFDRFMRTTDDDHKAAVGHFWRELQKRGYIYESKHEGWYAVSDETFYPQSQIHLIQDPKTGRKFQASKETNKEVEWTSEINYRFRLSAFKDRLLEHYDQHPNFIVPSQRFEDVRREVAAGLEDLSISRPSSRLQWGIRVPDDDSQTIYVWLDALINYLTMTGYPEGHPDRHKLWPPNVQVIGKDIVRFHTIYWPAFLMALDIPLPRAFLTHAHWTMGKTKMSKSLGNGVDPYQAFERFGVDTIRFFMIHDGGIADDADYENRYITERYTHSLQGQLGNLSARAVRSTKWSLAEALRHVSEQSSVDTESLPNIISTLLTDIDSTTARVDEQMAELNPRAAVRSIMELVATANKTWDHIKPWELAKSTSAEDVKILHYAVYTAAEVVRVACILLQPVMPTKMKEILDYLQVSQDRRSFDFARHRTDMSYGQTVSEDEQQIRKSQTGKESWRRSWDRIPFPPLMLDD